MANDDKKADNDPSVDPLLLAKVFPEAYAVFSFRPKTLDEVFSTAVFILDTTTSEAACSETPESGRSRSSSDTSEKMAI